MRDIPECLNKRYQALDDLINELRSSNRENSDLDNDVGIRLLCEFWNILKENPDYNLSYANLRHKKKNTNLPPFWKAESTEKSQQETGSCSFLHNEQAVLERLDMSGPSCSNTYPHQVTCYMAEKQKSCGEKNKDTSNVTKKSCCDAAEKQAYPSSCSSKSVSLDIKSDALPLNKVLCNLKEAASFDKKCNVRINDLMQTQKELKNQIKLLEQRETEVLQLLKQADCMWSCMEETYKKKVADSLERQKGLMKQLKEVEASATKWRKNKKDLEFQLDNINKCQQEMKEKSQQKTSDIKCMNMEIADFNKRIENNKKDVEAVKKSLGSKKQASDVKIANLAKKLSNQQKILAEEIKNKENKSKEGRSYIDEARDDLQKINKVLLQKKLQNEDLNAKRNALKVEIEFLKQTCEKCEDKCKNKQQMINDEIISIEKEIAEFKVKCIRCHQCTDTIDVRKLCTDCPRCVEERDCLYENDHCSPDHSMDCVCMSVKQKFLDNVFDNMYTVLEKNINTKPGKCVAEVVLNCLKRSRNGKLDIETRKILQDFILTTVKKNLNLTIVGGAVKTRCEMDPETYKQLMLCLKQVKVVRPPKEDKGTAVKKESCRRWGGSSECNCPKGPKECICTKKAPPPPNDPTPCEPDKEDLVEAIMCPHRDSTACGPDCAKRAVPSRVDTDITAWRPNPCKETSCPFSKNMRAAQCMLGPESLCSLRKGFMTPVPYVPDSTNYNDLIICKCNSSATKPCICQDTKTKLKADNFIQIDKSENAIKQDLTNNKRKQGLKDMSYLSSMKDVTLRTTERKGVSKDIEATIINTTSDNLAVDIKNVSSFGEISLKYEEYPGLLEKKSKNKILLDFDRDNDYPNETLKGSPSGEIQLIAIKPALPSIDRTENFVQRKEKGSLFKIKIRNIENDIWEPPAVLHSTPSNNYVIILDKEYRKIFLHTINVHIGDSSECFVELYRTLSDCYMIAFDDRDNDYFNTKQNALLLKSPSGNIKILVNGPIFDSKKKTISRKASILSAQAYIRLLKKITDPTREIRVNEAGKFFVASVNSSSDSHLFGRDRMKIPSKKSLTEEPSTLTLRKTASGHYSVILDKQSKKTFVKNVKNYLEGSQGLIPVRRAKSGEITIMLNREDKTKIGYGSLKITPSGNIYVIIDEKVIQGKNASNVAIISKQIIGDIMERVNKKVTTTYENYCGCSKWTYELFRDEAEKELQNNSRTYDLRSLKDNKSDNSRKSTECTYVFLKNQSQKVLQNNSLTINYCKYSTFTCEEVIDQTEKVLQYDFLTDSDSKLYNCTREEVGRQMQKVVKDNSLKDNYGTRQNCTIEEGMDQTQKVLQNNSLTDCKSSKSTFAMLGDMTQKCSQNNSFIDDLSLFHPEDCSVDWQSENRNIESRFMICDPDKCQDTCAVFTDNTLNGKKSSHIIIKPCEDRPIRNPKLKECNYMEEAVGPFHKYWDDSVSSELMEISGLCNNTPEVPINHERSSEQFQENWDSLKYLPPQLPPFLNNYRYR